MNVNPITGADGQAVPQRSGATVTLPLAEYTVLRGEIDAGLARIVELTAKLAEAGLHDPSGRVPELVSVIRDLALPIVQFAVANLDPLTVQGWPLSELERLASAIVKVPGCDTREQEMVIAFREFCREIGVAEEIRAQRARPRAVKSRKKRR